MERTDMKQLSRVLHRALSNMSQSMIDRYIEKNAQFRYDAGLSPKIIRTSSGHCCEWCNQVAGKYSYPDVPKDVYRRHDNCDCTVEYYNSKDGYKQDVWDKKRINNIEYDSDYDIIKPKNYMKMNLQFFSTSKERVEEFGEFWPEASLSDCIKKYVQGAVGEKTQTGKINYTTEESDFLICYDAVGNYFRIQSKKLYGKRKYLDLDGKNVANITENGRTRGRTKDEYESITHFKNIDSDGGDL